ncbi:MAG: hypothetical protein HY518_03485 [Candidatus Aenigmarchaeota archaeon]|nr:hypothetical protein [Candidatus Aenigmarchaeota archaeon]
MLNPGDVVLAKVQYTDTFEVKRRPAVEMNYIFTISEAAVEKKLFSLSVEKRREIYNELIRVLSGLTR